MSTDSIAILVLDETGCKEAQTLLLQEQIAKAGIGLCTGQSQANTKTYTLAFTPKGLELRPPHPDLGQPFSVDFNSGAMLYRIAKGGGKKQDIARAVGLKKGAPHVIDATCGFARDGFILASLGCSVALCERSPITHALVDDALRRAASVEKLSHITERISLHLGDSLELIPQLTSSRPADIIYLDPMYPHRSKSALVKKQMRLLRDLVGKDSDSDLLHSLALKYAQKRVVCKRPISAPFFNEKKPDFSIEGKKHRFDVYLSLCR